MKYLSNYIEEKQTKLFNDLWIFFAFSDKQFEEQKKEWIEYISIWSGIIIPKENADKFLIEHKKIIEEWIQEDIKENWIEKIIERELINHEAYYTYDIESTVDALEEYNIEDWKILEVFKTTYEKNSQNF